jgi:prepilin-type N-terminal cleavage/methylation domain-containing protein
MEILVIRPEWSRDPAVGQRGVTLVELMFVVAVMAAVASMAVMLTPNFTRQAKADAGVTQAVSALRNAREVAVSQRRNVRVNFIDPNMIQVIREEIPGPATTLLTTVYLENGMQYRQFAGQNDTPDQFGFAAPVSFGLAANRIFTSEGTFVDTAGDPLNGTVFLGRINDPSSSRAITIFGPTALIRLWRWDGQRWVE